jgi:hypothetical protein
MMRFYTAADCRRKADQHYEMAGLARQDGDSKDAAEQTRKAKEWDQRASEGGWEGNA